MLKLYGQINSKISQLNRQKQTSYIAGNNYKIAGRRL